MFLGIWHTVFYLLYTNIVIASTPIIYCVWLGFRRHEKEGKWSTHNGMNRNYKVYGHLFLVVLFSSIGSNGFCTYGLFFIFSMRIRLDAFIISTILCELHLWMDHTHIHYVHTIMTSYTLNFLDFSWWSITNVVMVTEFTYYHQGLIVELGSRARCDLASYKHIIDFPVLPGREGLFLVRCVMPCFQRHMRKWFLLIHLHPLTVWFNGVLLVEELCVHVGMDAWLKQVPCTIEMNAFQMCAWTFRNNISRSQFHRSRWKKSVHLCPCLRAEGR